jgi:hypothetical protein
MAEMDRASFASETRYLTYSLFHEVLLTTEFQDWKLWRLVT